MALHVYGLMRAHDAREAAAASRGHGSADAVCAVACEGLAMLVTDVAEEAARLRRDAVTAHADVLQAAFEHGRVLPLAATHCERIRIGEAIAGAVAVRRAADTDAFLAALRPLAIAVHVSDPRHERVVLNATFLVDHSQLDRFDAAVESLSEQHAGEMEFKLIGPMPAHSFADRDWDVASPSDRARGRQPQSQQAVA